ncbi:hypothetical protein TNCV_3832361 [Trichonephila clavipes]|nr:hypothetical protein TNCV_3832361 [Trichonephila clavipes]
MTYSDCLASPGRGSLVLKVTDSWLWCHEFESSTAEDRLNKNDNLRNPLKTASAKNVISAIKLFAFPAKVLVLEPVLPYILEEWI